MLTAQNKNIFNDPQLDDDITDNIPDVENSEYTESDSSDEESHANKKPKVKNSDKRRKNKPIYTNPFFVKSTGSDAFKIKLYDIFQNYSRVFFLCIKDDTNIELYSQILYNLYKKDINSNDLKEIAKYVTLVEGSIHMMCNINIRKRTNLIKKDILVDLVNQHYDLDELVVTMLELKESNLRIFLDITCANSVIETKLKTSIALLNTYDKRTSTLMDDRIIAIINSIDTSNYWRDSKNCKFNMNMLFFQRTLSYNGHQLDLIKYTSQPGLNTLDNLLTNIGGKQYKSQKVSMDDYYFDGDNMQKQKSEHMNIYKVLRETKGRTFFPTIDKGKFGITKESTADLFDSITDEKYRFYLFNSMILSKDLCHYVLNNKRVLIRNADLFEKYRPLYAYLIQYAWITFYLEEAIFNTRSTKQHRFVFDIDTAHHLPTFPFTFDNIHSNPYATLLLNRTVIDPNTNYASIPPLEDYDKYYGVCSSQEALARFNVFTSGYSDKNIFLGLDPQVFSFSGSIVTACIQKRSPLMDICTDKSASFDDAINTYFTHYYGESDVDVMCSVYTHAEFFHNATTFLEVVTKNLNCMRSDLKIIPNKKMAVVISKHFFKECVWDLNNELGTEYTMATLTNMFKKCVSNNNEASTLPPNILNYFYVDYVEQKNMMTKKWRKLQTQMNVQFDSELLSTFNVVTPVQDMRIKLVSYDLTEANITKKETEIYYFVNDYRSDSTKVPIEQNFMVMKFSESIKYKIESPKLKRTIEIFKINHGDPFNTVARFHLPCVRAYLQGDTFYMLPLFITSMMTSINIDYMYFASSRDPVEILNKYRSRGQFIVINFNEKKAVSGYNRYIDTSNGQYTTKTDADEFGPKELNHKIFRPGVYKMGMPESVYNESKHRYIKTYDDLKRIYKKNSQKCLDGCPIDMLSFTAIGSDGCIIPYKPWIQMAYYDHINS